MQFHPWVNRNEFLEMPDTEVKKFFRDWRKTDAFPDIVWGENRGS